MVEYKLFYFNSRGRAEVARILFALADQKYEDVRIEREKWPELKGNAPFGQLPYIEINDNGNVTKIAQSAAIYRYLARKFHFEGETDIEKAEVDMYGEQINDIVTAIASVYYETDPERKKVIEEKNLTTIPALLKSLEAKLVTGTGFLVGSSISWIDVYIFVVLDWFGDNKELTLSHFPHIKAHNEKLAAIPNIANWISKRPVTER